MKWVGEMRKSAFGQVCGAYHKEFVYWMHTPSSYNFKVGVNCMLGYGLAKVWAWQGKRTAEVYKRKRMRCGELQRNAIRPDTREAYEMKRELARLSYPG